MCTKFHWCLIKNNKVIEVWNFFYKSAFWLVGLDGKIMDLHQQNFSGQYWGVKLTCIPNFSEIGQFLQKLSHFIEFRLVGWLGWLGPSDFKKISRWKADGHNISAYKKSEQYRGPRRCGWAGAVSVGQGQYRVGTGQGQYRLFHYPSQIFSISKKFFKMLFRLVGPKKLI